MKILETCLLLVLMTVLVGCLVDKTTMTPKERSEQEQRMNHFLNESSPRNRSTGPKVTPEFNKQFDIHKSAHSAADTNKVVDTVE